MTGPVLTTRLRRALPAGLLALAAAGLAPGPAPAQDATPVPETAAQDESAAPAATATLELPPLDEAQEDAVRALVRETILEHPEILIEALHLYDERQKQEAAARTRETLAAKQDELVNDPTSPVMGNPDGDVVVVEFFDYRCPYCKKVAGELRQTIKEDGNIRLVSKEFPILGPDSIVAARAALAADKQQRYEDFHFKLMEVAGDLTDKTILAVAELMGLDMDQFRKDMNSDEVEQVIRNNYALAESLEIGGTPAFVIGAKIYPGAISMDDLREAVAAARAGSG